MDDKCEVPIRPGVTGGHGNLFGKEKDLMGEGRTRRPFEMSRKSRVQFTVGDTAEGLIGADLITGRRRRCRGVSLKVIFYR